MSGAHLAAEGLVVDRGGRRVLDGLDAGFGRGRVTAVVGPSGAGKTTLLRTLNRLEEPTDGRVLFDGRAVGRLDPCQLRRRVGMVFQTPVVFPGTVGDNLAYGLEDPGRGRLAAALAAAQLAEGLLDRDGEALSVGEAQRVTIARALVRDPEVLLVDEPTAALDRDAGAGIERLVRRLCSQRGLTVVFVTHDLDQAGRVADRAVLVAAGRVAAAGAPREVTGAWERLVS